MSRELATILERAAVEISAADTLQALDAIRVHYLGKKGILTEDLKSIGKLDPAERPRRGQAINEAKQALHQLIVQRKLLLQQQILQQKLQQDTIDITLAGRSQSMGSLHPVTQVRQRVTHFFQRVGYQIVEGPEVEDDYHNFEALNMPSHHPARGMHDTFYFPDGSLLRTHTSPVQIRVLQETKPPTRIIVPGRVYRCDFDVTHTPMFHQLEGLVVDEQSTFADLKSVLRSFLQDFFARTLKMRFRPSYFPFTEPSAEVDIACVNCNGSGCRVCGHSGWLEILGCGLVHPNVLTAVNIDPQKYQGFAFGLGLDRLAMLYYGIDDLRILFENDLRFLRQF